MELKRLGLARKPMFTVPNHMLASSRPNCSPNSCRCFARLPTCRPPRLLDLPRPKLDGEKTGHPQRAGHTGVESVRAGTRRPRGAFENPSRRSERRQHAQDYVGGRKAALDLRLMKTDRPGRAPEQGSTRLSKAFFASGWTPNRNVLPTGVLRPVHGPKTGGFSVLSRRCGKTGALLVCQVETSPSSRITTLMHQSWRCSVTFAQARFASCLAARKRWVRATSVQERLIALHHLDAPWRPADLEQREGRILRQGNKNSVVRVCRYVTKVHSTRTCGRRSKRKPSSSRR